MNTPITTFTLNHPTDIYNARNEVYKLQNWYSLSKEKKKEDYIWDEDMTVRQNKEYTAQYNAEIDNQIKQAKEIYAISCEALNKAIIEYIKGEFDYTNVKCTNAQAEAIWSFCLSEHEDDAQNWISIMVDFYIKMKELSQDE